MNAQTTSPTPAASGRDYLRTVLHTKAATVAALIAAAAAVAAGSIGAGVAAFEIAAKAMQAGTVAAAMLGVIVAVMPVAVGALAMQSPRARTRAAATLWAVPWLVIALSLPTLSVALAGGSLGMAAFSQVGALVAPAAFGLATATAVTVFLSTRGDDSENAMSEYLARIAAGALVLLTSSAMILRASKAGGGEVFAIGAGLVLEAAMIAAIAARHTARAGLLAGTASLAAVENLAVAFGLQIPPALVTLSDLALVLSPAIVAFAVVSHHMGAGDTLTAPRFTIRKSKAASGLFRQPAAVVERLDKVAPAATVSEAFPAGDASPILAEGARTCDAPGCGKTFNGRPNQVYCSDACRKRAARAADKAGRTGRTQIADTDRAPAEVIAAA